MRKINSLNCIHSFLCNKRASDSHQVQPCSWYYMVPFVPPPGQMLRIGYIFFSLIFVFFYQTKYCKNGTSHSFSNTAGIALHLSGTPRAGISLLFQPQQPAQSFTPFKKNKCRLWCEIQILCLMPVSFSPCKKVSLVTCVLYCIFPILS